MFVSPQYAFMCNQRARTMPDHWCELISQTCIWIIVRLIIFEPNTSSRRRSQSYYQSFKPHTLSKVIDMSNFSSSPTMDKAFASTCCGTTMDLFDPYAKNHCAAQTAWDSSKTPNLCIYPSDSPTHDDLMNKSKENKENQNRCRESKKKRPFRRGTRASARVSRRVGDQAGLLWSS